MSVQNNRLPEEASLAQLRKQAKELRPFHSNLSEAQHALARSYGFLSWPKMILAVKQRRLRQAIRSGDKQAFVDLLKETPRLVHLPFEDGSSPLLDAVEFDDPWMVETLIKNGADREGRYEGSAHNALSWALTCWSFGAAKKLVELGTQPDLFTAAGLGDPKVVESLLTRETESLSRTGSSRYDMNGSRLPCPPAKRQDQISDALYLACRCGHLEVARVLLDHGGDPNWVAYAGGSCLAWAEMSGNKELCDLLRSHGGLDAPMKSGYQATPTQFPLYILAGWGFNPAAITARLDQNPELVNTQTSWGTLLHAAAENGHVAIYELLLARGADPSVQNAAGKTAGDILRNRAPS